MMTRRDWWLGIATVTTAIVIHALVPRYEYRDIRGGPLVRIDRWTGVAVSGGYSGGEWAQAKQPTTPPSPTFAQQPIPQGRFSNADVDRARVAPPSAKLPPGVVSFEPDPQAAPQPVPQTADPLAQAKDAASVRLLVSVIKFSGLVAVLILAFRKRSQPWGAVSRSVLGPRWQVIGYLYALLVAAIVLLRFYDWLSDAWDWPIAGLLIPLAIYKMVEWRYVRKRGTVQA